MLGMRANFESPKVVRMDVARLVLKKFSGGGKGCACQGKGEEG